MKQCGVSRKLDAQGRFLIPAEIRRSLGITEGDRLSITFDGERITIEKKDADALGDLRRACRRALGDPSLDGEKAIALERLFRELEG